MLVASLAISNTAMAQEELSDATSDVTIDETVTAEDLGIAEPSDGFVGFLKSLGDGVQYALTFNPVKKAELKLKQANQSLLRAQKYLEANPDDAKAKQRYEKHIKKYEHRMAKVQEKVEHFKEVAEKNPTIDEFLNKLTDQGFKHQRIMDHVSDFLDEDGQAMLQEKRDKAIKTLGQALKNLDKTEKIPERLEKAMDGQEGSSLIHLKNLEVLKALESEVPEEALAGIKNAQEKSAQRLNTAFKDIEAKLRKDKFHNYLDNSHSDPLIRAEALQVLEEAPNLIWEIKSSLPAIKKDIVKEVDEMIEAFSDDKHKARHLERIRQMGDSTTGQVLFREIEEKYIRPEVPASSPINVDSLKAEVRDSTYSSPVSSGCPKLMPPAPGWCDGGKIIPGAVDRNGCHLPPKCQRPDSAHNQPSPVSSDVQYKRIEPIRSDSNFADVD